MPLIIGILVLVLIYFVATYNKFASMKTEIEASTAFRFDPPAVAKVN